MKSQRNIKYLTKRELRKMFKTIEKDKERSKLWLRDITLFQIAYYCWLRISELSLLKLEHYNKQTGVLYVSRLKGSNNSAITLDKKRRYYLDKYIREYHKKSHTNSFLFQTRTWECMKKPAIEFLVEKYRTKAHIPHFHFHMLKHSIAVHLLELWVSIFELKNYLGHKSINSTMVYSSFSPSMNQKVFETIEKWLDT